MSMIDQFKAARRVSTPLIGITTPDPAATMREICTALNGKSLKFRWDVAQGLMGLSDEAAQKVMELLGEPPEDTDPEAFRMARTQEPAATLALAAQFPEGAILFFCNAHRFLDPRPGNEVVIQAAWNLRDRFKENYRTLVLLAPDLELPLELRQDVRLIDEPLPGDEVLAQIVKDTVEAAQQKAPEIKDLKPAQLAKAVDALRGVAAFPAEQLTAENVTRKGIDFNGLWEAKRKMIEQGQGLGIYRGQDRFADLDGLANIKGFLTRIAGGKNAPRVVVFMDEFGKAQSGAKGGDLSGTSQKMTGTLLSFMEDTGAIGLIAYGCPGTGKTAMAKATGNELDGLTILFNISAMEGSLVGESVRNLRTNLKIVEAVAGGRALFMATANELNNIPPELLQRFSLGTWFFDMPSAEEREAVWKLYMKKLKVTEQARPKDDGWVPRNIKQCCELADRLGSTLIEASAYIVPVGRSAKKEIETMRAIADGNFISASQAGVYQRSKAAALGGARAVEVSE